MWCSKWLSAEARFQMHGGSSPVARLWRDMGADPQGCAEARLSVPPVLSARLVTIVTALDHIVRKANAATRAGRRFALMREHNMQAAAKTATA